MKTIFILFIYFHSCVSQNYFQPYNTKIKPYIDKNTDPNNARKNNPYIDGKNNPYIDGENHPFIEKITDPYNDRKNNPYIEKITDPYNDRKNKPYIDGKINPYIDGENNLSTCKTARSSWISFYDTNPSQDCVFPFVYKDEIYDGCVSIEDNTNLGKAVEGLGTM